MAFGHGSLQPKHQLKVMGPTPHGDGVRADLATSHPMKILITGGAGFIGSHLVEASLKEGWEVAILDDFSSGKHENLASDDIAIYEVDLRDREKVQHAFEEFEPNVVSHQAAQASVKISVDRPHFDADVNILGSLNLLDACVAQNVERVIFASTGGAIYGAIPEGTQADVDFPPVPLSPYAASKFAIENYLRCYAHNYGLKSNILRYANVYGPRQDPHGEAGVVAIFTNRLLAGEPLRINARKTPGDAGCVRDYVYVDDVVRANLAAIRGDIPDPILNVCTGIPTATQDLADQLQQALQTKSALTHGPLRPGDVEYSVLSPRRFQELIGSPVPLSDGLQDTVKAFQSHLTHITN